MRRTGQDCDCAPIALAAAVIVVTVETAIPAGAQDRLNLPEITIMGSPPPPDTQKPCTDAGSNDHSIGCLNQQMRRQVDQVNPSLNIPPIDAKSPDLKVAWSIFPAFSSNTARTLGTP